MTIVTYSCKSLAASSFVWIVLRSFNGFGNNFGKGLGKGNGFGRVFRLRFVLDSYEEVIVEL